MNLKNVSNEDGEGLLGKKKSSQFLKKNEIVHY